MTFKVSVITASWNSASTLSQCIDSVQSQEGAQFEHIVVDGGSTDETLYLLKQRVDNNCRWISETDHGIYDALNKGLALATGDVIGVLQADDVYSDSNVLETVVETFRDPSVHAVYGDLDYVSKRDADRTVRRWRTRQRKSSAIVWGWMPPHPTLFVRREWLKQIGGFDPTYRISGDYDCILRLFRCPDFHAKYIPRVMVKMRLGGASNRSLGAMFRKSREDYRAIRTAGVGGWYTLFLKNISKLGQFV